MLSDLHRLLIFIFKGNSTSEQMLNKEYTVFDDILTYDTYFFDVSFATLLPVVAWRTLIISHILILLLAPIAA